MTGPDKHLPRPVVLCIDDDPGILYTLQAIGELAGWDVRTARTGRSGLQLAVAGGIDLALVDYHMPDMDGLATVRRIRQRDARLPIVVLTVDESQELAAAFLAAGASDFALKPVKAPDLMARIYAHLRYAHLASLPAERTAIPGRMQRIRQLAATVPDVSGVNRPTLFAVLEALVQAARPLTAAEVAGSVGCAYPTASRYLNFLEAEGVCDVDIDYGSVGRPTKRYAIPGE